MDFWVVSSLGDSDATAVNTPVRESSLSAFSSAWSPRCDSQDLAGHRDEWRRGQGRWGGERAAEATACRAGCGPTAPRMAAQLPTGAAWNTGRATRRAPQYPVGRGSPWLSLPPLTHLLHLSPLLQDGPPLGIPLPGQLSTAVLLAGAEITRLDYNLSSASHLALALHHSPCSWARGSSFSLSDRKNVPEGQRHRRPAPMYRMPHAP